MPTPSEPSYRKIQLNKGYVALVDAADFEYLNQWSWKVKINKTTKCVYAVRNTEISMHRQILGLSLGDGIQVDHVNTGQTLDNRRSKS